jgi:type II secretion system protein D
VVAAPNQQPAQANPNGQQGQQGQQGLSGTVRVEVIPELNLLILYGKPEDVAYVQKVLSNLIKSADAAQPDVQVYPLKNVSGQAIAAQVQTLYDNNFATQQGPVSVTGLDQPNGLLLIGRKENIDSAIKLIENLDVAPTEQPEQFKSIRLKYMSAIDARERLNTYFAQQTPTGATGTTQPNPPLTFVADFRSNTLIVKGGAANIALVEKLIAELDVVDSPSKNEVRVFPIRNALASELAAVLQDAINGQLQNAGQGYAPQTQGAGLGAGGAQNRVEAQAPGDPTSESRLRSAVLELMTVDKNGKVVDGGILFDVRVSADANSNSLVVTGPSRSMDLIAALVERLDVVPDVDIKIKVFRLVHGDAPTLLTTLQQLFGSQTQAGNTGGAFLGQTNNLQSQLPLQSSSAGAGASIAGLRFGIDTRTNTLIVSGPEGDLQVIEDLIVRLDEVDIDTRSVRVYRLSNAPAEDVAQALNSYIDGRRDIITNDPAAVSAFEQVRRELIVIPEIVSNSLIISATPEYFAELESVIQALDRRPAMVKVKVLLAQVTLNAVDEFGVEVGVQDSLLFDRGLSNIRYPFNQTAIGNDNSALSLAGREKLAGQGLSNLSIGRSNSELGYGGLVLSAGNESINVLLRALQDRNAVRVLAKPHITTVDNLLARVQVGQRVPTITQVNQTAAGGFSNSIEYTDVGIILEITPRVSPDGTIVMAVNATNSSLSDAPGIPLFTTAAGADPITSPIINETTAETTIMAHSGQTVVLSGLLQDSKADIRRGIPILSDIPVLGPLFRFDSEQASRSELLIVLTPYLVTGDEDIEIQNQVEYDRMHWCLGDVNEVFGELGYDGGNVAIQQVDQPAIYYPDQDPLGQQPSQGPQPAAPQSPPAKMDGAYAPGGSPSAGFQPPANASYPQVYYPDGEQKLPAQTEDVQQPDYLDPAQRVPLSKSVVPKQASNTQRRDVAQVPNGNSGYGISLTSGANTTNNASKIDTGALLR